MEFLCANLTRVPITVIFINGPQAHPTIIRPHDSAFLPPGLGELTCCAKNHDFGGGPDTAECDKAKIAPVLYMMANAKVEFNFQQERWFQARFLLTIVPILEAGLEPEMTRVRRLDRLRQKDGFARGSMMDICGGRQDAGGNDDGGSEGGGDVDGDQKLDPLVASLGKGHTDEAVDVSAATRQLRRKLRWRGHLKERDWCRKTGTNLLWWAAAGDDLDAVKGIIAATSPRALHEFLSAGVAQDWPSLMVLKGGQALHQAMAYAHWPVASAVLDAGADHLAVLGGPRMDG